VRASSAVSISRHGGTHLRQRGQKGRRLHEPPFGTQLAHELQAGMTARSPRKSGVVCDRKTCSTRCEGMAAAVGAATRGTGHQRVAGAEGAWTRYVWRRCGWPGSSASVWPASRCSRPVPIITTLMARRRRSIWSVRITRVSRQVRQRGFGQAGGVSEGGRLADAGADQPGCPQAASGGQQDHLPRLGDLRCYRGDDLLRGGRSRICS
jgi:hypothetical protein